MIHPNLTIQMGKFGALLTIFLNFLSVEKLLTTTNPTSTRLLRCRRFETTREWPIEIKSSRPQLLGSEIGKWEKHVRKKNIINLGMIDGRIP